MGVTAGWKRQPGAPALPPFGMTVLAGLQPSCQSSSQGLPVGSGDPKTRCHGVCFQQRKGLGQWSSDWNLISLDRERGHADSSEELTHVPLWWPSALFPNISEYLLWAHGDAWERKQEVKEHTITSSSGPDCGGEEMEIKSEMKWHWRHSGTPPTRIGAAEEHSLCQVLHETAMEGQRRPTAHLTALIPSSLLLCCSLGEPTRYLRTREPKGQRMDLCGEGNKWKNPYLEEGGSKSKETGRKWKLRQQAIS
ncbi:PREDICTED: uncharacterized protein LOC109372860 isoform X2 [Hipposideros armiger]|uniref:Uncharacterized protein LOC109372860 isoform X2 n=1 Tax=Hipposideros armiger TaxID=186990 RepID=A0A8B7PZD4_HIPAR|nr:PREDICTED: uncharacterized protein LOC109372860 isoform X2 [Hipposideros armiger]